MTRTLRNLAFSLVLACLVLGALELGLRLLGLPDPGIYDGDTASLWTLRPNLAPRDLPFRERGTTFRVRTNSAGFRGPEPVPGAVLCLGDSTTFGWGVHEDEAWPARLGVHLGVPTIDGGVPGHTTVQGLATIDRALALRPKVVLLAYLVRDAEKAAAPDAVRMAAAPPPPPDLALLRALRTLRGPRPPPPGTEWRVPPDEYADNVRALADRARAAGATPLVLAFPMVTPATEHLAALAPLGSELPLLAPTLPKTAFFAEDPIHLTPEGNDALARMLAAWPALVDATR